MDYRIYHCVSQSLTVSSSVPDRLCTNRLSVPVSPLRYLLLASPTVKTVDSDGPLFMNSLNHVVHVVVLRAYCVISELGINSFCHVRRSEQMMVVTLNHFVVVLID